MALQIFSPLDDIVDDDAHNKVAHLISIQLFSGFVCERRGKEDKNRWFGIEKSIWIGIHNIHTDIFAVIVLNDEAMKSRIWALQS